MDAIKRNFEKTGKCGLQMAGDCFLSLPVNFALQKHSPYTETINKGYTIKVVFIWLIMGYHLIVNVKKKGFWTCFKLE
jgi:hypothetical protein